jgi:hypothetical protein
MCTCILDRYPVLRAQHGVRGWGEGRRGGVFTKTGRSEPEFVKVKEHRRMKRRVNRLDMG